MELRQLATFRAVASELSFGRAAAKLGYAQSSVSVQVRSLERELGVPLFDRLGKRVTLTDAGRALMPYSRKMLGLEAEARAAAMGAGNAAGGVSGSLAVGAPETLLAYRLPDLAVRFRARYPRVALSLRPNRAERPDEGLRRRLSEGALDAAFVLSASPMRMAGISAEPLRTEPLRVVASPAHMLGASGRPIIPTDLKEETLLFTRTGCAYRGLFEGRLVAAGVSPRDVLDFDSVEAIKRCVEAGMGIAVLPHVAVASEVEAGRVKALTWPEHLEITAWLLTHEDKWISPALEAFLRVARESLKTAS